MVCPRCIKAVEIILNECGVNNAQISLGRVQVEFMTNSQLDEFIIKLANEGFELLEDSNTKQLESVKLFLLNNIEKQSFDLNLSDSIAQNLNVEFTTISRLFSQTEGITIEHYYLKLKIEKAKEKLIYNQESIEQIAFSLGFSSGAHLSTQFKRLTGFSPSQFRKLRNTNLRKSLDDL